MNHRFCHTVVVLLFLCLASPAHASVDEANAALQKGDYNQAFNLILPLAEEGNATAQSVMGFLYYQGEAVPQDFKAAVSWWEKAAEQGEITAQINLGKAYFYGEGVKQDLAMSAQFFAIAAENGNAEAQRNLGLAYHAGWGVPKNQQMAFKWLNRAAHQDDVIAQAYLGEIYSLQQNYEKALEWYNKAADQGNGRALLGLGNMHLNGNGVPQNKKQGVTLIRQAAEAHEVAAQKYLALLFFFDDLIPKDTVQAYKWAYLAAISGEAEAVEIKQTLSDALPQADIAKGTTLADKWLKTHKGIPQ